MTPPNKLSKKADDDFDKVRRYLLSCTLVENPSENAAILAAIAGLDSELRRRERDARLQEKFSQCTTTATASRKSNEPLEDEWQDVCDERKTSVMVHSHNDNSSSNDEEDEVEIIDTTEGDTSFLGKKLAEIAVASIAESKSRAKTPLAAIALALHAALRSPELGFTCTGSVHDDDKTSSSSGFAKPIRDLPKTQFVDKDWDRRASSIESKEQKVVMRYRKEDLGTVLLHVTSSTTTQEISVKLVPASATEPTSQSLTFSMEDHINIVSWTTALRASKSIGVEPALHYKRLSFLMTAFINSFDLGSVDDEQGIKESQVKAFIGPTKNGSVQPSIRSQEFAKPIYDPSARARGDFVRPTIENAFPQRPMFVGDFSGDLVGGGIPPLGRPFGPVVGGNLMGPNHPLFRGGGMTGVGDGSGFGMMPRFDPFGPPGGPQEIDPDGISQGGRLPPHMMPRTRPGEPNPDHMRPPDSLGNNMFT